MQILKVFSKIRKSIQKGGAQPVMTEQMMHQLIKKQTKTSGVHTFIDHLRLTSTVNWVRAR